MEYPGGGTGEEGAPLPSGLRVAPRVDGGGGRKAGGGSSGGGAEDGRRGCRGEGERGRGGLVHDAVALEEAQEGRIEVGRLEAGHVQVDLLD